jgi:hypothetical protein
MLMTPRLTPLLTRRWMVLPIEICCGPCTARRQLNLFSIDDPPTICLETRNRFDTCTGSARDLPWRPINDEKMVPILNPFSSMVSKLIILDSTFQLNII